MGIMWELYGDIILYDSTNITISEFVKKRREYYKDYKITETFICQKCYNCYVEDDCAGYSYDTYKYKGFNTIYELKKHLLNDHKILFTYDIKKYNEPPVGIAYYKAYYKAYYSRKTKWNPDNYHSTPQLDKDSILQK
jgi:hypothetical protein